MLDENGCTHSSKTAYRAENCGKLRRAHLVTRESPGVVRREWVQGNLDEPQRSTSAMLRWMKRGKHERTETWKTATQRVGDTIQRLGETLALGP